MYHSVINPIQFHSTMGIPIVLYLLMIVCMIVFLANFVGIVLISSYKKSTPGLTMEITKPLIKKMGLVALLALGFGLGFAGTAQALGVGPMIWVSIKNRFLYGAKGCPCKPIQLNIPIMNPSVQYAYTIEADYKIKDSPFGTSEVHTCYLDHIENPTLKDLDEYYVMTHPEWKTRPNRRYTYPQKGSPDIPVAMTDKLKYSRLNLNVGENEQPLFHNPSSKTKNKHH